MKTITGLSLVCLVCLGLAGPAAAQGPAKLGVIVFPGGFNWPIWAAQEKGFFAREGLEVKLTPTPNSVFQLTNLIAGKFDIGMTAIDNVVAYQEGQGEAPITGTPDLFAFLGGDNGFLRLSVVPEVKTYADLKGKELSVDAMTTGYAFVLRKMVERGGLKEGDVTYVRAGGVLQRWEALKEKKHAGTMLITPFEIIAESMGFNRLGNAIDVFGHYQGLVGAARRSWAQANPEKVVGTCAGTRPAWPGSSTRATGPRHSRSCRRTCASYPRRWRPRPTTCSWGRAAGTRRPPSTWTACAPSSRCAASTASPTRN